MRRREMSAILVLRNMPAVSLISVIDVDLDYLLILFIYIKLAMIII